MKLSNQKGQTVFEYILLTGLIGAFCLFSIRELGEQVDQKVRALTRKLQRSYRSAK